MTENKDHYRLFADLDALTEEQIEVGLAAGVWSEQVALWSSITSMTSNSSGSKRLLTDWMKWSRRRGW
jgi:hypothetical protein